MLLPETFVTCEKFYTHERQRNNLSVFDAIVLQTFHLPQMGERWTGLIGARKSQTC